MLASDTIAAEDQLRAAVVGVIAFLIVPGVVMLVELSFDYQGIVLRAIHLCRRRGRNEYRCVRNLVARGWESICLGGARIAAFMP